MKVDTDRLQLKTMRGLQQLFDIANDYARGRVKWQTEDGKAVAVTLKQRQMWARITAYIAQVINTVRRALTTSKRHVP